MSAPLDLDARALRIALVGEFPTLDEWGARIEEILSRHLPAAPGAGVVTAEDVRVGHADLSSVLPSSAIYDHGGEHYREQIADAINARLRARATPAGHVLCRVVERPTEATVGALVVPEAGVYFRKIGAWRDWQWYDKGHELIAGVTAIQLYDPETLTRGPVIERETTPAPRAWRAEDIAIPPFASVVLYHEAEPGQTYVHGNNGAVHIARRANELNATALLVLPERAA